MDKNYDYFMKVDVSPYSGEWIAICKDKIVAHRPTFKEAFEEAKIACPHERPFVAQVPMEQTMIL